MSAGNVDIQYFAESGIWHRPPGAVRADCLIRAASGGGSVDAGGIIHAGAQGELHAHSIPSPLPETITIEIGKGGRGAQLGTVKAGDGADGYALIITHVAPVPGSGVTTTGEDAR